MGPVVTPGRLRSRGLVWRSGARSHLQVHSLPPRSAARLRRQWPLNRAATLLVSNTNDTLLGYMLKSLLLDAL